MYIKLFDENELNVCIQQRYTNKYIKDIINIRGIDQYYCLFVFNTCFFLNLYDLKKLSTCNHNLTNEYASMYTLNNKLFGRTF